MSFIQKFRVEKIDKAMLTLSVGLGALAAFLTPAVATAASSVGNCTSNSNTALKDNCIVNDLNIIINFLSAGVGIVIIGTIVVAGIQYTTAGENANKIEEAKKRIISGIVALVAFLLTFAVLQWLIPGGL